MPRYVVVSARIVRELRVEVVARARRVAGVAVPGDDVEVTLRAGGVPRRAAALRGQRRWCRWGRGSAATSFQAITRAIESTITGGAAALS